MGRTPLVDIAVVSAVTSNLDRYRALAQSSETMLQVQQQQVQAPPAFVVSLLGHSTQGLASRLSAQGHRILKRISKYTTHIVVADAELEAAKANKLSRWLSISSGLQLLVRQRINRARSQRLYLVQRKEIQENGRYGGPSCDFVVLGSTGNVYIVTICKIPSCTCPDHAKGNLCKHILFVLLKVARLPSSSPHVYQKALLNSELQEIFAFVSERHSNVLANAQVRKEYAKLSGEAVDKIAGTEEGGVKRKPLTDGDDCMICFEEMKESEGLTFCMAACGNNFHKECMQKWSASNRSSGQEVTCPACRQPWVEDGGSKRKAGASPASEGYDNLAHASGQSTVRDDSTYNAGYFGGGWGWSRRRYY
eukprot:g209.t1